MILGNDKHGNKLQLGDICKFTIDKKEYEGMITYSADWFAYSFDMKDDRFPCVNMYKADLGSIERIINVYATKTGDQYKFYRMLMEE